MLSPSKLSLAVAVATATSALLPGCYAASEPRAMTTDAGANGASANDDAEAMTDASALSPTFTNVYAQVLGRRSPSCPTGSMPKGNMSLETQVAAYRALVRVAAAGASCAGGGRVRVVEGNAAASLLVMKLAGTADCGDRMPLGGPYLDQAAIELVSAWIAAGAKDD